MELKECTNIELLKELTNRLVDATVSEEQIRNETPKENPEYKTVCSICGKDTTVPFKPSEGYPIKCKKCFIQEKYNGK